MTQSSRTVVGYAVALVTCLQLAANANGATASFQGLGDLPGGDFYSYVRAISADGSVAVGSSRSASGVEAFCWTRSTGMVGLGDLPGGTFSSSAASVSGDGSVIVGSATSSSGIEAFRWTADTGMIGLGDLSGGDYMSRANSVSDDGMVIVGFGKTDLGTEAFRYTEAGGMVGLGDLPGSDFYSVATHTSADGSIVVGEGSLGVFEGPREYEYDRIFRWTEVDGMVDLGFGFVSTGLSADGSALIGYEVDYAGHYSYLWTVESGFVSMNPPGAAVEFSRPYDISADGSVVVGDNFVSGPNRAAIWDEAHGTRYLRDILVDDLGLDLTGWELWSIYGVSDDGLTVVGSGTNPNGDSEAFIATLPEPGILMLMAVGAAAVLGRRG